MEKWFLKMLKEANDPLAPKEKVKKIATQLAAIGDPYAICDFCEFCERADDPEIMPILQKPMEENENPLQVYEFAYLMADCGRKNVNYASLLQKIIDSGDPKLICYSREFVPVFNKQRLDTAMSRVGNCRWLHYYDELTGFSSSGSVEAKMLRERLALVDKLQKEGKMIVPEALKRRVDFSYRTGLVDAYNLAMTSKEPYYLTNFFENFPNADKRGAVLDRFMELGDILSIYEYGASAPNADIRRVEIAAIMSKMPKYMYYVAAYCPGADAELMLKSIENTPNVPDEVKKKYTEKLKEHMSESGSEPGGDE